MKITEAVFFTDNEVVRLETKEGNYYLTRKKKVYDMHPSGVMANEISGSALKEVMKAIKSCEYKNDKEVRTWL